MLSAEYDNCLWSFIVSVRDMSIRAVKIFLTLVVLGVFLTACVEVKEAGKSVGHSAKELGIAIGHGSRDAARTVSKGTVEALESVADGMEEAADSVKK